MKKGLCEPNRYEITVRIPQKAIMRGKAENPAQGVNFVAEWYVIHITPVQNGSHLKNG